MESIKHLLKEVITCNIINDCNGAYSYNGVALNETSAAFQKRLNTHYEAALMEIPFLNKEEKEGFENLINKYIEIQASFDTPKESHLKAMDEEIANGNNNPHLKRERDFVEMVCECVYIQKYYLKAFADAIGYTLTEQTAIPPIEVKEEASSDDTNLIKGVKGLAAFLGCGINTAQNIINSEILLKGKIQYRTGKGWRFRRDKLTELLEKEPEIFKKVGSK